MPGDQISQSDLKKVKKEMDRIIKADYLIVRSEISRSEARYNFDDHPLYSIFAV